MENSDTIRSYLESMQTEINARKNYEINNRSLLNNLSKFHRNKSFRRMKRDDVIAFLNSLKKPEDIDPLHRWIGSYNNYLVLLTRFFRWLYNPKLEPKQRPKPNIVQNIPSFKRREVSIYKPTDLWTREDDLVFLKYCPDIRIRCYHTISRDLSARPSEILDLRIKDIIFKTAGDKQYAECLVNGKTGTRHLPLISSLPYIKDWLDHHPARNRSSSHLICSMDSKNFAGRMTRFGIHRIYNKRYKSKFFPDLLKNPDIPAEDKDKIRELLKKPWNPYARRHSALTEKSKYLREHTLRQHAGWSGRSQMHLKYLHYFGNESSNSILQEYGIIPKDNVEVDVLKPKECPNCKEPNRPDQKFCVKCKMVLTFDAYNETLEKENLRESELKQLRKKYESDLEAVRVETSQKFNQIMAMIQQNPQLAQIKSDVLVNKVSRK